MWKKIFCTALLLCLAALPLAADGSGEQLRALADDTRAQAGDLLSSCAADRGLATQGEPVFLATEDTASVLMPLAGVESLTRADLADWTDIGIFTASGPIDASAPSGTFTVRVQAKPGSTVGQFEIVDADGLVVQSGEISITDDPDAMMTEPDTTEPAVFEPGSGGSMLPKDDIHFGSPYCYYPYYWHWRIYPYYYHGCYWWWYRWPWGHLNFRYCWWPSYYHCTRWFCHWW